MLSAVSRTMVPAPGSAVATSALLLSCRRNTSRRPSGDHRAWAWMTASLESEVTCRGLRPVVSATQIRRGPAQVASNERLRPSGAQAGPKAFSTTLVSAPVARSRTHTSPPSWYQP